MTPDLFDFSAPDEEPINATGSSPTFDFSAPDAPDPQTDEPAPESAMSFGHLIEQLKPITSKPADSLNWFMGNAAKTGERIGWLQSTGTDMLGDAAKNLLPGSFGDEAIDSWAAVQGAMGESLRSRSKESASYWLDQVSEEFTSKASAGLDDPEFGLTTLYAAALGSLPEMMLTMGSGAVAGKLTQLATKVGTTRIAAAAAAGSPIASKMLSYTKYAPAIGGAVAGGVTEGSLAAAATGVAMEERVNEMTHEELYEGSERYRDIYDSAVGESEEARRAYAKTTTGEEMARTTASWVGLTTTALGAPTGAALGYLGGRAAGAASLGGVVKKLESSVAGQAATGFAAEGAQEFLQEGSQQFLTNLGLREYVNPKQALGEGVFDNAVIGGLVGGMMGGAITPLAGGAARKDAKAKADSEGQLAEGEFKFSRSPILEAKISEQLQQLQESGVPANEFMKVARWAGQTEAGGRTSLEFSKALEVLLETGAAPEHVEAITGDDFDDNGMLTEAAYKKDSKRLAFDVEMRIKPANDEERAAIAEALAEGGANPYLLADGTMVVPQSEPGRAGLEAVAESITRRTGAAVEIVNREASQSAKPAVTETATVTESAESTDSAQAEGVLKPRADGTVTVTPEAGEAAIEAMGQGSAFHPSSEHGAPTERQLAAGNYPKGRGTLKGVEARENIPVSIENVPGSIRRAIGGGWSRKMKHWYGYVRGTKEVGDGKLDVYIGKNAHDNTLPVFVVHQNNPDGTFDEPKVVMGYATDGEAKNAYLSEYPAHLGPKLFGGMTRLTRAQFADWLETGETDVPPNPMSKMPMLSLRKHEVETKGRKPYSITPHPAIKDTVVIKASGDLVPRVERLAKTMGRWSPKLSGFIVPKAKAKEFEKLYASGFDGNAFSNEATMPASDAPAFSQNKPRPNAVSAVGVHYSAEAGLKKLDPAFAGSGSSGGERRRFGMGTFGKSAKPGDTARRLYFYEQTGNTLPKKESAVTGTNAYRARLDNLYDLRADPEGVVGSSSNIDQIEETLAEMGYDGFIAEKQPGMHARPIVLFGLTKNVPVASVGATPSFSLRKSAAKPKVPTSSALLRNLTASEQLKVTNAVAAKIVSRLEQMPSVDEYAAVAHAGRAKKGWYKQSSEAISNVFGYDAPRFAALLAAMSPQTSVQSNLRNALNTWVNWNDSGRPTDRESIIDIMAASVEGGGRGSVLNSWINNTVRALSAEDPTATMLSGPKVDSFMRNLMGDVQAVTLDTWMANFAAFEQAVLSGTMTKADPGKRPTYLAMSARIREAAEKLSALTGEEWTPSEVQETVWSWAKTLSEMADSAGEIRSAEELVTDFALTEELIRSTPDFGNMFADREFASILEDHGYAEQVQQIRSRQLAGATAAAKQRAQAEATPFDREAQLELERAAARRLDIKRKQARGLTDDVPFSLRPAETTSKEFIKFFGKSQVVNKDGSPRLVFRGQHGKGAGDTLQSRMTGITFVEGYEVAKVYAQEPNNRKEDKVAAEPTVLSAYLRIENPAFVSLDPFLELSDLVKAVGRDEAMRIARKFDDAIYDTGNWIEVLGEEFESVDEMLDQAPERLEDLYFNAYRYLDDADEVAKLVALGYDGAIHEGNGESASDTEYRIFSPEQARVVDINGPAFSVMAEPSVESLADFRNDPSLAFTKPGWTILTATQEANGPANGFGNITANARLEEELAERGLEYQRVSGSYQGVDQGANFLVLADEETARELGNKYGQESVLTSRGLLYFDGRITPAVHEHDIFGDNARAEDFYSQLPSGEAFSLGLDFDATTTDTRGNASINFEPNVRRAEVKYDEVVEAAEAMAKLKGAPTIHVHKSESDLPSHIRNEIAEYGAEGMVEGYFDDIDGGVHIITSNVGVREGESSRDAIERVLAEETLGHYGLRAVFGKRELNRLFDQVWRDAKATPRMKSIVKDYSSVYGDIDNVDTQRRMADEYLAKMDPNERPTLWQKVTAWLREALRNYGFVREWNDNDLKVLMERVFDSVRSGHVPNSLKKMRKAVLRVDGLQATTITKDGRVTYDGPTRRIDHEGFRATLQVGFESGVPAADVSAFGGNIAGLVDYVAEEGIELIVAPESVISNRQAEKAGLVSYVDEGARILRVPSEKVGQPRAATAAMFSLRNRAKGSDEVEAILKKTVQEHTSEMSWGQQINQWFREMTGYFGNADTWLELKTGWIDSATIIEKLERAQFDGKLLDASESAYKMISLTKNLPQLMAAVSKVGVPQYKDGTFVRVQGRKGLYDIFAPLFKTDDGKNLLHLWEGYAVARRSSQLIHETNPDGTSKEKLLNSSEIEKLLELEREYPVFRKVFDEWQTFNKQLLALAVDRGALSQEAADLWTKNDYVPFYRVDEEEDVAAGITRKRGLSGQRVTSKRLTGSDKRIQPVLENIMLNSASIIEKVYKNEAMNRIVALLDGVAMTQEPLRAEAVKVSNEDIARAMKKAGLFVGDDTNSTPLQRKAGKLLRDNDIDYAVRAVEQMTDEQRQAWTTLFRRVRPEGQDVVSVMVAGKPVYYRVHDPLVLRAVMDMTPTNFGALVDFMGGAKRLLTTMVTLDPGFMVANWMRDTLSSWVVVNQGDKPFKGEGFRPFRDAPEGIAEIWNESGMAVDLALAGGMTGGFYDPTQDFGDVVREATDPGVTLLNSPKKLVEAYRKIGMVSEQVNRLAIAKAVLRRGGSLAEAAYQAQDVLNFSQSGDAVAAQLLIRTVPFLNARIQGLYRLWKGARGLDGRDPQKARMAFLLKGIFLAGISLLLEAMNGGDERYEQLPEYQKDTYWHFFVTGKHYAVPKPFEVGVLFGTLPARALRLIKGDDKARTTAASIQRALMDTFAFNPVPQLFKPIVEQWANRSFFTDRPIVGLELEGLEPQAQYNPWTSETARAMAGAVDAVVPDSLQRFTPETLRSPTRLEHAMRAYLGTMGGYLFQMSDAALRQTGFFPEAPAFGSIRDVPVIGGAAGRFVRGEPELQTSTKYADNLYDALAKADDAYRTLNAYINQGNLEAAEQLADRRLDVLSVRPILHDFREAAAELNTQQRFIMQSDLPPEEKRQALDEITRSKNALLKESVPYLAMLGY